MRDVVTILKQAYYALLKDNIIVGNKIVPVFDSFVPTDKDYDYYVLINSVNTNDISTKNSYDQRVSIVFSIFTKFKGNATTAIASDINDQLFRLTYNKVKSDKVQIINTRFVSSNEITIPEQQNAQNKTNNYRVVERNTIFSHLIHIFNF